MRSFATCAILLALACSAPAQQQSTGQGIQAPAVPSSGDAAARVGNRTITIKEVDERWRRDDAAQQTQALQQLYDGRRNAARRHHCRNADCRGGQGQRDERQRVHGLGSEAAHQAGDGRAGGVVLPAEPGADAGARPGSDESGDSALSGGTRAGHGVSRVRRRAAQGRSAVWT